MKNIIEKILAILARKIIKKYQPQIIGITGSLGKTSAANAVFAVLAYEYNVRQNPKNYNNEIGLPLTVINAKSGEKNILKWLGVFLKAIGLLIFKAKDYPEILVLEMGVDIKGDLDYLIKIARPEIGVLTAVSETHLEPTNPKAKGKSELWLKDIKGVLKEKQKIVTRLNEQGIAVLNYDDSQVISIKEKIKTKIITYGFSEWADLKAIEVLFTGLEDNFCQSKYQFDCKTWGMSFKAIYNGSAVPVFLPNCFGKNYVYAALAGIAVGLAKGMNLVDIAEGLSNYQPAPGRMNLIPGIKHSLIVDDTYNSPAARAVITGLEAISEIDLPAGKRKIIVLGDMLELGETSDSAHREVGLKIAELGMDIFIAIGKKMLLAADAAIEAGLDQKNVYTFSDRDKAGRFLQDMILKGDLIFLKGSQGMRMEKVVLEIMAEPKLASQLLVRQSESWVSNKSVDVTK